MGNLCHRILNGDEATKFQFTINGESFSRKYNLVDGIFPKWPVFVQAIPEPISNAEFSFSKAQESARKDIERLFGVVKARFKIIRGGNRIETRSLSAACAIMRACFVLHNMIITSDQQLPDPNDLHDTDATANIPGATVQLKSFPKSCWIFCVPMQPQLKQGVFSFATCVGKAAQ
jgi:hypothetical protein